MADNKVRILQVLDYINNNSGVSSVVMNYYSHIADDRLEMDFLLYDFPEESFVGSLSEKKSKIFTSGHPTKLGIKQYYRVIKAFFENHRNEYDIVHIHIPNAAFVILSCAKRVRIETRIIHAHNARGADGFVKKVRNYFLNRWGIIYSNNYFACSKLAGEYLYGKKLINKVEIINNAIALGDFEYNQKNRCKVREELNINDEIVLGHVGRFCEQKNHDFLVKIAARLKRRNVEFKLLLLGDGDLKKEIEKQVSVAGITDNVIFTGVVTNVKDYLDAMDVFLLPSLYEGLPCVCIEAQANGLPCILSANITREVGLSKQVRFVDITNVDMWCDEIIGYVEKSNSMKRTMISECDYMDKYDIVSQAALLKEKYLLLGKRGLK